MGPLPLTVTRKGLPGGSAANPLETQVLCLGSYKREEALATAIRARGPRAVPRGKAGALKGGRGGPTLQPQRFGEGDSPGGAVCPHPTRLSTSLPAHVKVPPHTLPPPAPPAAGASAASVVRGD